MTLARDYHPLVHDNLVIEQDVGEDVVSRTVLMDRLGRILDGGQLGGPESGEWLKAGETLTVLMR